MLGITTPSWWNNIFRGTDISYQICPLLCSSRRACFLAQPTYFPLGHRHRTDGRQKWIPTLWYSCRCSCRCGSWSSCTTFLRCEAHRLGNVLALRNRIIPQWNRAQCCCTGAWLVPLWRAPAGSTTFQSEVLFLCPRGRPWFVVWSGSLPAVAATVACSGPAGWAFVVSTLLYITRLRTAGVASCSWGLDHCHRM